MLVQSFYVVKIKKESLIYLFSVSSTHLLSKLMYNVKILFNLFQLFPLAIFHQQIHGIPMATNCSSQALPEMHPSKSHLM